MTCRRSILILDNARAADALKERLVTEGFDVEVVTDGLEAVERLNARAYDAIVIEPLVRSSLNGFGVLSFIELDQPRNVERVFLRTVLSEQTVMNTAPSLLPRLFRKPCDIERIVAALRGVAGTLTPSDVLLAEDDVPTSEALQAVMAEWGYSVRAVESGREAIRCLAEGSFHHIVLDLMMPDVDGFALLDHLKATRPEFLRRTIVTTGIPDRYLGAIDAGRLRGVLHKPIDVGALRGLLAA
jgi:CheY-like chemotaxis protein